MPPKPDSFGVEPVSSEVIFNDSIIHELFHIVLSRNGNTAKFKVGIRRPNQEGKWPVIIKNDRFVFSISDITDASSRNHYKEANMDKIDTFMTREAYKRGYVICKFIRDQVAPDNDNYKNSGVHTLYPEYDWGVIAAWAWAYQVIIDHLETLDYIDAEKVVATGHSRGGKAALCAGVYDERISVTAPNSSGTGGTGSWRHFDNNHEPQTLKVHEKRYQHWWTSRLFDFVGKEEKMPFDAHFQKAVIAPRGLVNPHSREDYWANPYGTYLTYLAADKVYQWLGAAGNQGVHWRNGPHNQNRKDWLALFEFCDQYFYREKSDLNFAENPWPEQYNFEGAINFRVP